MRNAITTLRDLVPLRRLTTREALQVAEVQAERLLRLAGVSRPPVPGDLIDRLPRIQVEHVRSIQAAAATQWSRTRWVILINANATAGRQRWSLAHELKHILDHPFESIIYPVAEGVSEPAEQACDYFASCLLMPRRWVRAAWLAGIRDPRALARRFGVSRRAIRIRLLQIGLIEPTSHYLVKEV